jgi:hypothetical protein
VGEAKDLAHVLHELKLDARSKQMRVFKENCIQQSPVVMNEGAYNKWVSLAIEPGDIIVFTLGGFP